MLLDGGAYTTLSPVVLSRGVLHATGPYRCDNVLVQGRVVMTNTPAQRRLPRLRRAADPVRRRGAHGPHRRAAGHRSGRGCASATPCGRATPPPPASVLGRDTSALAVLREAVRRTRLRAQARGPGPARGRGIGLSLFFHGAGFTGGGEVKLASQAALELTETGVRILVASTEIGQGTRTMHAQIVADTLGHPLRAGRGGAGRHRACVPDSGPTVASRTCMVVGKILQRCAQEMKRRLRGLSPAAYLRAPRPAGDHARATRSRPGSPGTRPPTGATPTPPTPGAATSSSWRWTRSPSRCGRCG